MSGDAVCPNATAEGEAAEDLTPPSDHFMALLDTALREIDDQVLVTQSRCVDHLLDLMNATQSPVLRRLTMGALDSVRLLGVVRGDELHVALSVLAAAANVECAAAEASPRRWGCC